MIITLWTADPGWMLLFSVVHLCSQSKSNTFTFCPVCLCGERETWWLNMFLARLLCCGSGQPPGDCQIDCPILHVHLPPSPLGWPSLQSLPQQRLPMKLSRSSKSHPSFMAPCLLSWASQQCKNGLFEVKKNPNQLNIHIKRTMWPKVVLQ